MAGWLAGWLAGCEDTVVDSVVVIVSTRQNELLELLLRRVWDAGWASECGRERRRMDGTV
ncbi:MAG: hypothetical protein GY911_08205 [Actinomycetales bacterium]|nr:hypothetical protein [Actinomycetales bacterium]